MVRRASALAKAFQGRWRIAEMDAWDDLQADGSLVGEIIFHAGDEIAFTARHWPTSSTAC
jgi:hypothetical protein